MSAIEGYDNYLIFEDGKIINTNTGKEMKNIMTSIGYYTINLFKPNPRRMKRFTLHRLIALAYIPNPDNKPFIDHINRDRGDNRIENLRWVSIKENNINKSCYSNTGYQHISKIKSKTYKQGFTYKFTLTRPELKHNYSNKELQPVIEYRNKFCAENDIEFNDK